MFATAGSQFVNYRGYAGDALVAGNHVGWTEDTSAGDLTLKFTGQLSGVSDTITQSIFVVEVF